MKFLRLLALALFCPSLAFATANVSGKLVNPNPSIPLPVGSFARFELRNCGGNYPQVFGASVTSRQDFPIAADGTWSGLLSRNDEISCNGSFTTYWTLSYFVRGIQAGPSRDFVCSQASCIFDGAFPALSPITSYPAPPPPAQPLTGAESVVCSFPLAATTWTCPENMGTQQVLAEFFDLNSKQIFPDQAQATDVNTFVGTFLQPQAGFMRVVNVGNWTPSVSFPNYLISNPTSDQSVAGDHALSLGGSLSAKRIEGVRSADGYTTLNAAVNEGSGTVFVPDGNYVLTADLTPVSNTTILCQSRKAIITMPGVSGNHNIVTISGVSNVKLKGCQIDGTGMTASGADSHTVRVAGSNDVEIANNYIHDSPEDDIRLGPSSSTGNALNINIHDNLFVNAGLVGPSGSCVGSDDATRVNIHGNTCITPNLDGVDDEPNCASCDGSSWTVTGNTLVGKGSSSNGISFFNGHGGTLKDITDEGNTVVGFAGSACHFFSTATTFSVTGTSEACLYGAWIQNSTLGKIGGTFKSGTDGIRMDGASSAANSVSANISNFTNGINEVNSASGNDYSAAKLSANTNNFGTLGSNSTALLCASGGCDLFAPQATAGLAVKGSTSATPPLIRTLPSLGAGNFNGLVQAGDEGIIYTQGADDTGTLVIGPKSAGSKGVRVDGTGKFTFQQQVGIAVATGTAPLAVVSTTPVTNLNVANHPTTSYCGTTTTCANTAETGVRIVTGKVALTAGAATIGSITAFTGTSSMFCRAQDETTPTNAASCIPASSSSLTIGGTGTDTISYTVVGW